MYETYMRCVQFVNTLTQNIVKSCETFLSCFYYDIMTPCQVSEFSDHIFIFLFFLNAFQIQVQNKVPKIVDFWKFILYMMYICILVSKYNFW
jgi:hypothetical protein